MPPKPPRCPIVATLKALLLAERATAAKLAGQNEHLRAIVRELQRALFGRRSEKTADPDQLLLALEDIEQALASSEDEAEQADATQGIAHPAASWQPRRSAQAPAARRDRHRARRPDLSCCGGAMHRIGEDVAERPDVIPAQFRVIVTHRPR